MDRRGGGGGGSLVSVLQSLYIHTYIYNSYISTVCPTLLSLVCPLEMHYVQMKGWLHKTLRLHIVETLGESVSELT